MTPDPTLIEQVARALYAERPFFVGSTATTQGHQLAQCFDWDGAPAYYQGDMLQLARAAIAAMQSSVVLPSEARTLAGSILPHSLTNETALQYEKRALLALTQHFAMRATTPTAPDDDAEFQARVSLWMDACFTPEIKADRLERCDRFIEEALELIQTEPTFTADRAHALVDYVFGRAVGEADQEVGGVLVTLAALCGPFGINMAEAGEREVARISAPETIAKIRAKQAAKPTGSALPIALSPTPETGLVEALMSLPKHTLWCVGSMEEGPFARLILPQPDGSYLGGYVEGEGSTPAEAINAALSNTSPAQPDCLSDDGEVTEAMIEAGIRALKGYYGPFEGPDRYKQAAAAQVTATFTAMQKARPNQSTKGDTE